MSLNYEFRKAVRITSQMTPDEKNILAGICKDIRQAENDLNKKASVLLSRCITSCNGICCRNIRLDEIIGIYDFIYLLTLASGMRDDMTACLKHEALFSADCIFLKNGNGPCIFPSNTRPRMCITTFCFDDTPAKREIQDLNRQFNRLSRFIFSRRLIKITNLFHL